MVKQDKIGQITQNLTITLLKQAQRTFSARQWNSLFVLLKVLSVIFINMVDLYVRSATND